MGEVEVSAIAHVIVAAMFAFSLGLVWFLREIFVATNNLRIGSRRVHGSTTKH